MTHSTSGDTCDSCMARARNPDGEENARRATHFGTCQVCFSEQLLPGGMLALHGYKRPGTGEIYGRCPGSGALPYEQDVTLTTEQRELSARLVRQFEGELAAMKAHPPGSFVHSFSRWGKPPTEVVVKQGDAERYDEVLHERIPSYASLLESAVYSKEREIRYAKDDLKLYTQKVAEWKLCPLKPVPPEEQKREWARRSEESAARLQALRQEEQDLERRKRKVDDALRSYKHAVENIEYRKRDAKDPQYADLEAKEPGWGARAVEHAERYASQMAEEARKLVGPVDNLQDTLSSELKALRAQQKALKEKIAEERANRINPKTGLAPPKKFEWPKKLTDDDGNVYNLAYKNGPEGNHTYLGKRSRKFARVERNLDTGEFALTAEDYEPLRKPRMLRPG